MFETPYHFLTSDLQVFQVGKSKSNMPASILFNNQIKSSLRYPIPVIGVDVFRTEAEVLTMCNNNIVGQIASVWLDSGSSAHRIANELQVNISTAFIVIIYVFLNL